MGVYVPSIAVIVLLSGWLITTGFVVDPSPPPVDDTVTVSEDLQLGEDAEYHPTNNSVEVVLTRDHDGTARTKVIPFEEYAAQECLKLGNRKIHTLIDTQFEENDRIGHSVSATAVHVSVPEGVSRSTVDRGLPDRVEATVRIDDRTHTCTVPVRIERGGDFTGG